VRPDASPWSLCMERGGSHLISWLTSVPIEEDKVKRYVVLILHLFNGTIATMAAGIVVRKFFVAIHAAMSGAPQTYSVEIYSYLPAFVGTGIVAGYISYLRVEGKSAFWVFVIPVALLTARILMFPSPSVFESGIGSGWSYFFGNVRCSAYELSSLAYTASRCVSRLCYLGAIGASSAYSVGAALGRVNIFPAFDRFVKSNGAVRAQ
jgi:hypothetical protein